MLLKPISSCYSFNATKDTTYANNVRRLSADVYHTIYQPSFSGIKKLTKVGVLILLLMSQTNYMQLLYKCSFFQQMMTLLGLLTDAGKPVVLVGENGCGKTAIVNDRIRTVCSGEVAEVLSLTIQANR